MYRQFIYGLALIGLLSTALVVPSQGKLGPDGCEIEDAVTKDFSIIAYNDVYELKIKKNGRGGASRVAQLIEDKKKLDKETLVLFAGDTISPSLWSRLFKGTQMIEAHNILQLDFGCLGNHEFDFGVDVFHNASALSKFTWLNANCYEISTNELLKGTVPRAIKKVHNTTIGIFGVMYDLKDNSTGVYWTDPIEAAKEQVKLLKEEGAEFIIALTHQVWKDDNTFATKVEGLDLIYGGHDHKAMLQTDFGTPYYKADSDWASVWTSEVKFIDGVENFVVESNIKQITKDLPTNREMEELIAKYDEFAAPHFKRVIAQSCDKLDASQAVVRGQESELGNFIADSIRDCYNIKADVAITNGGGIRSDSEYNAGDITIGDINAWLPFGNTVFTVKVNGEKLRTLINKIMKDSCSGEGSTKPNGEFMHVSGFSYTFQCTGENEGSVVKLQWDAENSQIRQEDILSTDEFVLATNDFVYEYSKPIFDPFGTETIVDARAALPIDGVVEKAAGKLGVICPKLEGRITLT